MSIEDIQISPVRRAMLGVLGDRRPHTCEELQACMYDSEFSTKNTLTVHLSAIRRVIRNGGLEIACEMVGGVTYYRLVSQSDYTAAGVGDRS